MTSLITQTAARYILALVVPISLFLLLRGHNSPGGGFIAGLVTGSAFFFYAVIHGNERAEEKLLVRPVILCAFGLFLCLLAAVVGLLANGAVLESYWLEWDTGLLGKIKAGTPLLFDSGVYLTVTGSFLMIVLTLIEEYQWK